jgi:hypothetical protein
MFMHGSHFHHERAAVGVDSIPDTLWVRRKPLKRKASRAARRLARQMVREGMADVDAERARGRR